MRTAFFWLLALIGGIAVANDNHWTNRGILCALIVTLLGGVSLFFNWGGFFESRSPAVEAGSSLGSFFIVSLVGGIVIGFLIVLAVSLVHALYRGDSTLALFQALWLRGILYGGLAMGFGYLFNAAYYYGIQVFGRRIPRS